MENESPIAFYPLAVEQGANRAFGPPPGPADNSAFGPPPAPVDATAFGTHPAAESYVPPSEPPPSHQTLKTWLAGALAAAVFGIGGFFGIQAVTNHSHASTTAAGPGGGAFPGGSAPGGAFGGGGGPGGGFPGGGGTVGTVASINGSTLTLSTRNGTTVTVTATSSTTVTAAVAGSVSDIKAGDHVTIRGTSTSGGVTADQITDTGSAATASPAGGPPGRGAGVSGTVASLGAGSFTVTEAGGTTVTVTTTSSTNVTVVGPSTLSAIAVGDSVRVTGTTTNGTVAASSIESGVAGFGPGGGGPGGPGGGFGGPPNA